jgi:putative sigma-54 modulation protein
MRQIVHGKNVEVTPALGEYVKRKLGKMCEIYEGSSDMQITLSVQGHKHEHVVEVTTRYYGRTLRVEVKQDDMYAAIDLVADKLERSMRKLKEKLQSIHRKPGYEASNFDYYAEEDEAVVRTKKVTLKPVDLQEAILDLQLLDHDFHLFLNRDTNLAELVYKRGNGTYGHITQE